MYQDHTNILESVCLCITCDVAFPFAKARPAQWICITTSIVNVCYLVVLLQFSINFNHRLKSKRKPCVYFYTLVFEFGVGVIPGLHPPYPSLNETLFNDSTPLTPNAEAIEKRVTGVAQITSSLPIKKPKGWQSACTLYVRMNYKLCMLYVCEYNCYTHESRERVIIFSFPLQRDRPDRHASERR